MAIKRAYLSREDLEQIAVADYCRLLNIPMVHIPNEGKRSPQYATKLKRMGMQPGFPDIFIPIIKNGYHGLFIEMKYGRNKPTATQKEWLARLSDYGYKAVVNWGADEAIETIKEYMG